MELLIIFLLAFVIILIIWVYFRLNQKNSDIDIEKIVQQILLANNQSQLEFLEKVLEKIDLNQNKTQNLITESDKNIQEKLTENLNQIKNHFEKQEINQRNYYEKQTLNLNKEFEKLKSENLENLNKIQNAIQDKLEKAITNLVNLNKDNFELLSKSNQDRLNQINLDVQKRLDENFARNLKSFQEVTKNLGQIQSTAQKMIDSTKSVDKLNAIFSRTSSKSFGNFGEKYLETILRENLAPNSWQKQAKMPNSEDKIDFLIYLEDKKIGIDSKFPVTKYQDYLAAETTESKKIKLKEYFQAVLAMAKDINQKYFREDFIQALFIYLPSDSMYSEVVNNQQVLETLQKLKVTPASPATVFPLVMIINQYQLKMQVSQNAESIIQGLQSVSKNINSFREEFRKLGDKIRQAQTNYDQADRSLIGVEKNILSLKSNETKNNQSDSEVLI